MTELQIFFIISVAITLLAAVMVVTIKNLVHAAFYLILALFGVAVLFVLLNAAYLAVVQVVVYIGAIAILMIMVVMVTRRVTGEGVRNFNTSVGLAGLISILVGAVLILGLNAWPELMAATAPVYDTSEVIAQLGSEFVGTYVIPTILASLLLLAALVGAIIVAWPQKKED